MRSFLISCALLLSALTAAGASLTNGNFESGNTGFTTSGYTFQPSPFSGMMGEGFYSITTSPQNVHSLFLSFGDHTTGSGNMMVVNGSNDSNTRYWQQTVTGLTPGLGYIFGLYVRSVYPASPASLTLSVNGVALPEIVEVSDTTSWQQRNWTFVAAASSADLALGNTNTAFTGNDFAIDDLSLTAAGSPVPEPGTWMLLGAGLVSCALLRRR